MKRTDTPPLPPAGRLEFPTTHWSVVLAAAARLGESVSAVKSAIWRLRRRHEALVREAIAQTLDANQSVEEEIRYLLEVAGARSRR